jgi:hypothetical protein
MTSHLDADVLADYREGLLGERRSARIRAHLTGCAQCSSLDAGLAEVSKLLAGTPTPPMPDHLVTRLENALATEATARSKTAAAGGRTAGAGAGGRWRRIWRGQAGPSESARPSDSARPSESARPRRWSGAVLGAAAVIALILVVGGVYGLARTMNHNGQSSASAGGANAIASGHAGGSRAELSPFGVPAGSLPVTDSGTNYQPGTLTRQVDSLLGQPGDSQAKLGTLKGGAEGTPTSAGSPRLRACVMLVTGGVLPRLVDVARYQGRPATVIVQAVASGKPAQVWVVGPGCSATQRDLIAHTEITGS